MSEEMERGQLIRMMMGSPPITPPHDSSDLVTSLTADQVRACLTHAIEVQGLERVHISRIRSWVMAKLRGVTRDNSEEIAKDLHRVVNGDYGANLESIGDIISLRGGFYVPAPSTAVVMDNGTAVVVSGKPSLTFMVLGSALHLGPVGRTLEGLSVREIREHGFRLLTVGQYCGQNAGPADPSGFLASLAEQATSTTTPGPGCQVYSGEVGTERGFNFGSRGRQVQTGRRLVSLMRGPDEWTFYLAASGDGATKYVQLVSEDWRRVALAIDAMSGHPRDARIIRISGRSFLEVDFGLPSADRRLLFASRISWHGFSPGGARYNIPPGAEAIAHQVLARSWIQVRGR